MSCVLIVDDSPADRALFRTVLSRAGFQVAEVAYGRDALERAREFHPHVVVLDVNLPDMDGHEVCRSFRADPQFAGLPILMLTVRHDEADVIAGLEAGADDYVAKDSASAIFLARVRRLVNYRQMAKMAALNEQLVQVGRLLAGIVHEIRGPLSVIRGNAEILRHQLSDQIEFEERIEPIIRGCQLLQLRLEHLMTAVRSGPPVLQPIELSSLVNEAAELFRKGIDPTAGKVAILNEVGGELPLVHADAGRMMQVLLNLLSNAREAMLAAHLEGAIVLRASCRRDRDREWVTIEVIDDGPGIPPTHVERIFEPFFTTKASGSGYGLYLASEIVREHGGRLTACNSSPSGAQFSIWLPLKEV